MSRDRAEERTGREETGEGGMGTEAERTGQEASSLIPIHSCIDCYCSFVNHGISSLLRSFFSSGLTAGWGDGGG